MIETRKRRGLPLWCPKTSTRLDDLFSTYIDKKKDGRGKWTQDEIKRLNEGFKLYGYNQEALTQHVGTKNWKAIDLRLRLHRDIYFPNESNKSDNSKTLKEHQTKKDDCIQKTKKFKEAIVLFGCHW